jgi:hypothetical protein
MLQVFCISVTKYIGMLHMLQWLYMYVSSVCSKCFIIRRMLQVFSSGCCKSRSRCCIYKHVASVFFKWFEVFHTFVASISSGGLQWFPSVFRCFCKCFKRMFQVFHLSSLHIATVAFGCFKSRSGDAHGMRVGSDATSLPISLLSTKQATIEIPYSLQPSRLHDCVRPPYSVAPPPPSLAAPPSHVATLWRAATAIPCPAMSCPIIRRA